MEFRFSNKQNNQSRLADVGCTTLDAHDMRTGCEQPEGEAAFFLTRTNNIRALIIAEISHFIFC